MMLFKPQYCHFKRFLEVFGYLYHRSVIMRLKRNFRGLLLFFAVFLEFKEIEI